MTSRGEEDLAVRKLLTRYFRVRDPGAGEGESGSATAAAAAAAVRHRPPSRYSRSPSVANLSLTRDLFQQPSPRCLRSPSTMNFSLSLVRDIFNHTVLSLSLSLRSFIRSHIYTLPPILSMYLLPSSARHYTAKE